MDFVVGMGEDRDIADIVASVLVLEDQVGHADVTDDVFFVDIHEVGVGSERHLGFSPLVDVEGVQVCISHVRIELIGGVLGRTGEVEEALEDEIQILVVADDPAVESFVRVGPRGPYVRIIVPESVEAGDPEGIDDDLGTFFREGRPQAGLEGELAYGVGPDDRAEVEIHRPDPSFYGHILSGIEEVADVQIGDRLSEGGGCEGAVNVQEY